MNNESEHEFQTYDPQQAEVAEKKSKKGFFVTTITVVVLLFVAGGVFAAWHFTKGPAPKELVAMASENFWNATSYAFVGSVEATSKKQGDLEVSVSGKIEEGEKRISTFSGSMDATVTLASGGAFAVAGDGRLVEGNAYARLTKMPAILAVFGVPAKQWIRFEDIFEKAEEKAERFTGKEEIPVKEIRNDIVQIFQKNDAFTFSEPSSQTQIDGHTVRHIVIDVNEKNLQKAMLEAMDYLKKRDEAMEGEKVSAEDVQKAKRQIQQTLSELEKIHIEVWIGTDKHLLRKVKLSLQMNAPESEIKTGEISAVVTFSDFGKNFNIKAPEDSMSVKAYMQKRMQSFSPGSSNFPMAPMPSGAMKPPSSFSGSENESFDTSMPPAPPSGW